MKWQHQALRYTSADEYIETAVEQLPDEMADNEELIKALDYLRDVIVELDQRPSDNTLAELEIEYWQEGIDTAIEVVDEALYDYRLFDRQTSLEDIRHAIEEKKEGHKNG